MKTPATKHRFSGCLRISLILILIGGILFCAFIYPILREGNETAIASHYCQNAADIGRGLWKYASDHDGKYPEGRSSTEVFQKLLDGGYITDPSVFYCLVPDKVKAESKSLKPVNVCWDVTCSVDDTSPDDLPIVFGTGYKISYKPGYAALPLRLVERTFSERWSDWWNDKTYTRDYLVICTKAMAINPLKASPDGTIPNFIPADFDPKGKIYHQLTPDGELPP